MMKEPARNLRLGFGLSMLLLILSSAASYYVISKLIYSAEMVSHTNQVLKVSENVLSGIKDGETGQRGFLLTQQEDFLEPYNGSYDATLASLAELRNLTKDNLQQQLNVDTLDLLLHKRFAILAQAITEKRAGREVNIFMLRDGSSYMQRTRLLVQKIQHIEEKLLAERTTAMDRFVSYAPKAIILATILSLAITIYFFTGTLKDFKEKETLANSLRENEAETNRRIDIIQGIAAKISGGDYAARVNEDDKGQLGSLSGSLNKMAASLDETFQQLKRKEWLQAGTVQLSEKIAGDKSISEFSSQAISFIAEYMDCVIGAIYLNDAEEGLYLRGGYSLPSFLYGKRVSERDGIIGQCFANKKPVLIRDVTDDLYTITAAGTIRPRNMLVYPISFEGNVIGVIELGSLQSFDASHMQYLQNISELLGVTINTALSRMKLKELLEETQAQSEELQSQHSELENMNAELEIQTEKLQTSEEELKVQQEELLETNQELEERSRLLEEKNHLVVMRNLEIQKKIEELAESTRYKSEFLANMSHELRTPLNAVLLLSRLLSENNDGNLTDEQIEYATVIQSSGNGLLRLIDEILDLSKIESGKIQFEYESLSVQDLVIGIRQLFEPMAKEKKLEFSIEVDPKVPVTIETDRLRVEQVIKNLISNSLKFTASGSIKMTVAYLENKPGNLAIMVRDTGIGIPEDKQELVFEAFQQADGSTKRKYGGTGLGLSISRELARLMSGDLTLKSIPGQGSTFTFILPTKKPSGTETATNLQDAEPPLVQAPTVQPSSPLVSREIPDSLPDDRASIGISDKVILIVEDDTRFAKALIDFAQQKGYKVIHIVRGDEVMPAVLKYKPMGLLMDIQLPVKDGLSVMDDLKKDARTRLIPVHIMSSFEVKKESLSRGAVDFINKPIAYEQMGSVLERIEKVVNTELKKVLIVEDNSHHARALAYYLSTHTVMASVTGSVEASITALQTPEVNCVILDMGAAGNIGYESLDVVRHHADLEHVPIIIFTGKNFSRQEEQKIRQYADTIVVKTAHSYQRILNEVSLFLHLVEQSDDKPARPRAATMDAALKDKTVLVADDDVRNIFALTKALEKHKMKVITAIDGREAINELEKDQKIDIILMDMMMPEMDGYETTARIRKNSKYKRLPIIAVTAKAMSGDREKCIQAGASDYISKPVDTDQLLSLMRVWLYEN